MLTDLQRHNLSILADYLLRLPVDYRHFEMRLYNQDHGTCTDPEDLTGHDGHCHTSACAVGHVPYAGILGWEVQTGWNELSANLLGVEADESEGTPFNFLFSDEPNPDCPWAAALRIRHFLRTGETTDFAYPHGLTLEQYQNLRRLAAYLIGLPEDYEEFDMQWWTDDFSRLPQETMCGTVACAGGHGPRAGIDPIPGENWGSYIERAFTPAGYNEFIDYIFGSSWARHDNTPQGAGKRILYALHNDIPTEERYHDPTVYGG